MSAAQKAHDALAAKRGQQVERGETLGNPDRQPLRPGRGHRQGEQRHRRRESAAALATLAKSEAKPLAKADSTADALGVVVENALEAFALAVESTRPTLASVEKAAEAARAGAGGVTPEARNLLGVYFPSSDLDGLATATPLEIARRFVRVLEAREHAASWADNRAETPNAGRPWPKDFKFTVHAPAKDY